MIPTLGETLLALAGLWRFAREGAAALAWFDRSPDGLWRSFGVAVIVAPLQIALIAAHTAAPADGLGWFGLITTEASSYVIGWVAFPLALYYIVARSGRLSPCRFSSSSITGAPCPGRRLAWRSSCSPESGDWQRRGGDS